MSLFPVRKTVPDSRVAPVGVGNLISSSSNGKYSGDGSPPPREMSPREQTLVTDIARNRSNQVTWVFQVLCSTLQCRHLRVQSELVFTGARLSIYAAQTLRDLASVERMSMFD
jgi:hypothetical protein